MVAFAVALVVLIGAAPGGTSPSWSFGPFAGSRLLCVLERHQKRLFHPQFLFRVNPGNDVSASLALVHKQWALVIVDVNSGV